MARDFGNMFDFTTMTDDEIYDVVIQHLGEYPNLDIGWIDVAVRDGKVTLSGRVATDGEAKVAEQALTDVLGIENVTSNLVVDELHRGDMPEAADEAIVYEEQLNDQLGGATSNQSDTAAHLVEDLESETFGTHDMGTAIEEGTSYQPPERIIPDGYGSRESH